MQRPLLMAGLFLLGLFLSSAYGSPAYGSPAYGAADRSHAAETLRIYVSVAPQRYIVQRIGGDMVEVEVVVPAGSNSHIYTPTPRQVQRLGAADIWFTIGLELEQALVPRVARATSGVRIVAGVSDTQRHDDDDDDHDDDDHDDDDDDDDHDDDDDDDDHDDDDHDHDHDHDHDPHVWLDPGLMGTHAAIVRDALIAARPQARRRFTENSARLLRDIERLDAELRELLAPLRGQSLYVAHAALGYFCEAYGLRQRALEQESREPTAAQLERLIADARREQVRLILVQPGHPRAAAETIAAVVGAQVVEINPLAEDWPLTMRSIAQLALESRR